MESRKLQITYKGQEIEIAYSFREGQGSPIVYLHGGGCSKNDFDQAENYDSQHTLMAFDFPGHGSSSYPQKMALEIDDLVEITDLIFQRLFTTKVILIGHSMGGLAALLYAEKHPQKIKAFLSIEGNLTSQSCTFSRKIIQYGRDEWIREGCPKLISELKKSNNIGLQKYGQTLHQYESAKALFDYCKQIVEYSDNGNLVRKFINLPMPKAFLYGSENSGLAHISSLRAADIPVFEISKSNHFPFYDNPSEHYQLMWEFVNTVNNNS